MNAVRNHIGGHLDYSVLAQRHRPADLQQITKEIHRLHTDGLTPRDIAMAMRLDHAEVINILGKSS